MKDYISLDDAVNYYKDISRSLYTSEHAIAAIRLLIIELFVLTYTEFYDLADK